MTIQTLVENAVVHGVENATWDCFLYVSGEITDGMAVFTVKDDGVGMSQEQLAEKARISRSHLSAIEAPNMVRAFSMEAFFNIADALDVTPEELIQIAFLQDKILKRKS